MLGKRKTPEVTEPPRRIPVVVNAAAALTHESHLQQLSRSALRDKFANRRAPAHVGADTQAIDTAALMFDSSDREAFLNTARSVEELGASGLIKKDKKAFQLKKLAELQVEAPKLKIPVNVLRGMQAKNAQREEKQRKIDVAAGNLVKKRRVEQPTRPVSLYPNEMAQLSAARRKSVHRHETHVARDGALRVSRSDMRDVARSAKSKSKSLASFFKR